MTALTPETVAKHAEAWTLPDLCDGATVGLWRFFDCNAQTHEDRCAFVPVAVIDGHITTWDSRYGEWDDMTDMTWMSRGTWTPVRPDGSDLPADRAQDREDLIEAKRKAGEQAIRLAALEEGWHELRAKHGGCAGWIRKIEGERDSAYDRGRADGRAEERAAIMAGVQNELDALRAEKSYFGPMEQAWTSVCDRLKAGEWSAKP